jgi:3-dehydroquinate synthase
MNSIELNSSGGVCRIYTGESLTNASRYLKGRKTIIIADENVIRHHAAHFPDAPVISVAEGEDSKKISNATRIYEELLNANVDRSWFILGIGGGVTTDLAGFIASTYMRGLPFGFISTTLLGQVDASIGGKNGVNLEGYKNIVGVIRQPEFVICDIELLKTLNKREFVNGWAEVIKCAAILERDFFTYLEKNIEKGLSLDETVLNEIVYQAAGSKVRIVEGDEFESGNRKLLNFGHTFAHGLEKLYKLPHGEAVSIGMVLASKVSVNLGILNPAEADQLLRLISRAGLPVHFDFDPEQLIMAMQKDKKRAGDTISLILLKGLGHAVIKPFPVDNLSTLLYDLR